MITKIPILIPVKGYSQRCNRKNHFLLPYTAKFLHSQKMGNVSTVITDTEELAAIAKNLNLKYYIEKREPEQDELRSCFLFAEDRGIDLFYLCPVTQPFKSNALIKNMSRLIEDENKNYDFITTASYIADRRIFYINNENENLRFKFPGINRKGNLCPVELMIDGVMYLIKTSFLKKVINSEDGNKTFWNGNFKCVINEAPFMDIDTMDDMRQFRFLKEYFSSF